MNLALPPVWNAFRRSCSGLTRTVILGLFAFFLTPLNGFSQTADITFCVDLSCFTTITAPTVFGAFNGWNAGANPITDPDGDETYCATIAMTPGDQEYKFFFQEEGEENMTPGDPCTVTNFGFTNRVITVVAGVNQMVTFGWEVCDAMCPPPPPTTDITLCVDLSCFQSVTAPTVFGAFNGWNAGANPITDPDNDGTYCAIVPLEAGDQEYKFFFQEEGPEDMTAGDPCTVTNFGFTNRLVTVVDGVPQMLTYGWETCDAMCPTPPPTTDITLCVDLSCFQSVTAPTVFGAFNGWNAGANPVTDPDGDGTYCAVVAFLPGAQEYKFFFQEEGPEDMTEGDPCTVTNFGFTNRVVNVVDGVPQMLTYAWEICDAMCPTPPPTVDIELCVDLSCFASITAPTVFGAFNGWNAGANPITDPDGDGTYCAVVALLPGPQEYKFFFQEEGPEDMTAGDPCTVTNFGFTNRVVDVVAATPQMLTYGWEVCDAECESGTDITLCVDLSCFPSVTAPSIFGTFNGWCANCTPITDPDGDMTYCATIPFDAGDQEYKFFFQEEGEEVFIGGEPCTVSNFGFTNRVVTVVQGVTQMLTYGWEVCGMECIPALPAPELPITFENEATIDYSIRDFGGTVSMIAPDPTDPANTVVCTNKTAGAATWAGTVIADGGLATAIPFTIDQQKISVRVWSPAANVPVLLKVEYSSNPGVFSEVLATTTTAMMWETLVFDFSMGNPPVNLANVYDKVVIFFNFGNIGTNQIYYFDDIMMCPIPTVALTCPDPIMADGCAAVDVPPYADLAALIAAGGSAIDADPNSLELLTAVESGTCPLTITRTYQVTDLCKNTATCVQTVTISDTELPTIICPVNQTVECESDIVVDVSLVMANDNCATGLVVTAVGPTLVAGQADCSGARYEVVYSTMDVCNAGVVSCTQTWTLSNAGPSIVCPAGLIVECAEDIVVDPSDAVVTTACMLGFNVLITGPEISNGFPDCPGTEYTYYYVVQDDCGRQAQCDRTFTIQNDAPTVVCAGDEIVECVEDIIPDFSSLITTSSCGAALSSSVVGPTLVSGLPNCFSTVYELVYTVSDLCGRSASCTQMFTIENSDPIFTSVPLNKVVLCSSDIQSEEDKFEFEVSCELEFTLTAGAVTALDALGDCPGAQYSITYTLEDACSRIASYTQNFEIENNAPRVFPEPNQTVSCMEDVNPRWEDAFVETDCNMGIVRYEIIGPVEDDGQPECNGKVINYLYSVWDGCGRMTCVAQSWTIENDGPSFDAAPGDVTVECAEVPDGLDVTVSYDGCGGLAVTIDEITTDLGGANYRLDRTFTATDSCGNTVSHDQRITVMCAAPPSGEEYCTETEYFWGNGTRISTANGDMAWRLLLNMNLKENPLVLGLPERSLTINTRHCVMHLLPSRGAISAFPAEMGDIVMDKNCDPAPVGIDSKGRILNRLAGQVAALMLNERMSPDLSALLLSEICLDFPEATLIALPANPQIKDLRDLGNAGLGGVYTESLTDLHFSLYSVNKYFVGCRVASCGSVAETSSERTEEEELENTLSVLQVNPNPATSEILMNYQLDGEELDIRIFNTSGHLMYQQFIEGSELLQTERIEIADWPIGFYFVTISNGDEILSKKLIKQ